MPDLYDVLGVDKSASEKEIKTAFRQLSMKHHPDKNPDNQESLEKFQEISAAYDVLGDTEKRKQYDAESQSPFGGGMPPGFAGGFPGFMHPHHRQPHGFEEFADMNNVFNMMFGGGGGGGNGGGFAGMGGINIGGMPGVRIFHNGQPFGGHPFFQQQQMQKPPQIIRNVDITLEQCYQGCTVPMEVERWVMVDQSMRTIEREMLQVTIPRGLTEGDFIVLQGKGNRVNDELKGDIRIGLNIKNTSSFQRQGMDLILKRKINLKEALCGFSFEIQHLNGKILAIQNKNNITVITPNYKHVVPNMGMIRDNNSGNLIIEFDVEFPEKLTLDQIEKIRNIL
jgi:DnaJ family protein B protein 4